MKCWRERRLAASAKRPSADEKNALRHADEEIMSQTEQYTNVEYAMPGHQYEVLTNNKKPIDAI